MSERIRDLFVSSFTGLAGAGMPWGFQYGARPDLSYWQEWLASFFEDVDLKTDGWTPNRIATAAGGGEVLYLENVNTGERVGIMQNRRYNFYYQSMGAEYVTEYDEFGIPYQELSGCADFQPTDPWVDHFWYQLEQVDINSFLLINHEFQDGIKVYNPMTGEPNQPIYEGPTFNNTYPNGVYFYLHQSSPFLLFKSYGSSGRMSTQTDDEVVDTIEPAIDWDNVNISVWPNPASADVNIQVGPISAAGTYELLAVDGRAVLSGTLSDNGITRMSLTDLSAGSYIVVVELSNGNKRTWKRLEVL